MSERPGRLPPSHLHVLHSPPAEPPRSITARGVLYWIAALVSATNATLSSVLAFATVAATHGLQVHALQAAAMWMPLWGAAVALVLFHSPAALTLLTLVLGLVQVLHFVIGIFHGDALRTGIPLVLAVSTLAVSIPLLAEQALKRQRWLRALRARLQLRGK